MNNLVLPESSEERKEASERIIAQLMTRALLLFPTEEIEKETFLKGMREQYKRNERLAQGHVCKWGKIDNPIRFLKNLKSKLWEFEGVKNFYDDYFSKMNEEEEHMIKLWYVEIDLPELKQLIEHFFSDNEERKNQATEKLRGIGVEALDDLLIKELNRIYNLPPLEFLKIYYQYFASTREENPIGEKPFAAQIEKVQGLLFECFLYDLVHIDDELNNMVGEKLFKLVEETITIEEKITILKKLLTLFPSYCYTTSHSAFPENSGYWLYSDVIETLGRIGGEEAEEVLLEIAL